MGETVSFSEKRLVKDGLLDESGEPIIEQQNILSAVYATPLLEAYWESIYRDKETLERTYEILNNLVNKEEIALAKEFVELMYGIVGLIVPEVLAKIFTNEKAAGMYISEFILDFEEIMFDFFAEDSEPEDEDE